jgi:hypothetical protein
MINKRVKMESEKIYNKWTKIENPETDLPDYGEKVVLKLKNGDYVIGSRMHVFSIEYEYDMLPIWLVKALTTDAVAWMRIKPYGK